MLWCRCALLFSAVACSVSISLMAACTVPTEPQPAPIIARQLGGDSLQPGPMVIVCKADDAGCVPAYAVACDVKWARDSAQVPTLPSLSPEAQAWCAAQSPAAASDR
jgi:hypothetical protein